MEKPASATAPPVPPGRETYGPFILANLRWLAFAFLMTLVSSVGQSFFIGLFAEPFRAAFGLSHSDYAALYASATIVSASLLISIGRQIDHVDLRIYTAMTLIGLGLAAALAARATSLFELGLAIFLLRLCGQGLCFHIAMTCMARWFAANRGKALSIAALGMPLGEAVLPGLVLALGDDLDWRASWWLASAIVLFLLLPAVLLFLSGGERRPKSRPETGPSAAPAAPVRAWTRAQVLRDPAFLAMIPAFICGPAFITAIAIQQRTLADALGWGALGLALAWPAFALTKVLVSLPGGAIIDRFGAARPVFAAFPLLALGFVIAILIEGPAGAVLMMTVFGCHVGISMTGFSAFWAERYGTAHIGAIKAMCNAIAVLASACGPLAFGIPLDSGMRVETILLLFAGFTLAATIGLHRGLFARRSL